MYRVSLLVFASLLGFPGLLGAQSSTTEAAVEEPQVGVVLTSSQEILRPGDPFIATISVTNGGECDLTALTVRLTLAPQAVAVSSTEASTDSADAVIDANGMVTWDIEALPEGETVTFQVSGSVPPQVVTLQEVLATATVSQAQLEVAREELTLLPVITVIRKTSTQSSTGPDTIVTSIQLVPNAELFALTVTETLSTLLDAEPVRPVPTKRVDNARASSGRIEWFFPTTEVGQQIELEYQAEYPAALNIGIFDVTVAGKIADDRSELFFSGEEALEIRTPLLQISGHEFQDNTPDDPFRPGDTAVVTITVENSGAPTDNVTLKAVVAQATLEVTDVTDGTPTDFGATWNRTFGDAPSSVKYMLRANPDILEDRESDLIAMIEIDGTTIPSDPLRVIVDTERRQGSNTGQWFALIVLFMVLGFGLVLFFAKSTAIEQGAGYVAVVLAILAAILILAFGLELAAETTLTLLGAIAGYVLGNKKWEDKTNENKDTDEKAKKEKDNE